MRQTEQGKTKRYETTSTARYVEKHNQEKEAKPTVENPVVTTFAYPDVPFSTLVLDVTCINIEETDISPGSLLLPELEK